MSAKVQTSNTKYPIFLSGALRLIRDISRKPESAPVLKQKYYQNIAIHEVYLEAVPAVLILATMVNNGHIGFGKVSSVCRSVS